MKKTLLSFLCFILFIGLNFAQPFAPNQNIDPNTGQEPNDIASGDLDGDGDMDLVMSTYFYNGGVPVQDYIKWYKNDGTGNFTINTVSTTLQWIDGLTAADIDGQFGLDIVATSANQNKLVYFLSDGTGFGPEVIVDNALLGPGQVVAGDINNDGNMDLATMSYSNNRTVWYSGDGTGNFSVEPDIENGTSDGPYYIDLTDFDSDGDLDAVVGFVNSQSIEIFYNQYVESGTMTVSWIKDTVSVDTGNSFLFALSFGDVNNDGTMDVVKVDFTSGDVAWYNKTKNGPSVETIISDLSIIENPATALVTDLDNDTYNDVIVTDAGAQDDALIYFKGASNASPNTTPILIENNNHQLYEITVEDFDVDGDQDIAAVGNHSDSVEWYENLLIVLALPEASMESMSIYPNPTSDYLNFEGAFTENVSVSIYDLVGKQLMTSTVSDGSAINVSELKSGIYLLKFEGSNASYKFIKN